MSAATSSSESNSPDIADRALWRLITLHIQQKPVTGSPIRFAGVPDGVSRSRGFPNFPLLDIR